MIEVVLGCENCKYWKSGECRRRCPNTIGIPARRFSDDIGLRNDPARIDTVWPTTEATDWCGDHEERTV